MTVGHPDWQGIAPLSQAIQSLQFTNQLVAAQSVFSKQGQVTRQGYEIQLRLGNQTSGVVATPVLIEMIWQEQQTLAVTGYQRWWVFSGDQTGAHNIVGQGPSNGNLLTLIVTNFNAGVPSLFASATVLDVARPYQRHDWRTRDQQGPQWPGATAVTSDIASGVYAVVKSLSIPLSSSVTFTCPLYAGKLEVKSFNTGTSNISILLNNQAIEPAGAQNQVFQIDTVAATARTDLLSVNANQATLQINNNSATAATTVFVMMTTIDY